MTDEQLKKIQDEIMGSMDKELEFESSIISISKEIAAKMILNGEVREDINGRALVFKHRTYSVGGKDKIFMTVANEFMYQVGLDKYKPYMVDVEIDNDLTFRENLSAVVEAFLRHIFDMVKAEEL